MTMVRRRWSQYWIGLMAIVSAMLSISAPAHAMGLGINIAFNPYGLTFATGHYSSTTMGGYLTELHNDHLTWVRVWACEGLDGLTFDGNGNCTGLSSANISNIQDFARQANALGITVEFVFINYMDVNAHPNLVENTANMNALIANGVVPLGKAIEGYTARIDLINEGDYTVPTVGWGYLRNFLGGARTALTNAGVDRWVTMSIGFYQHFGDLTSTVGGLGFDFYEYHMYDDNGWCAEPATLLGKPVEMNEFGSGETSNGWKHQTYAYNQNLLKDFISSAQAIGYDNIAPWSYVDDGDYQLRGNLLMNDLSNWAAGINGSGLPSNGITNGVHSLTPACAPGSRLDVPSGNFANGQSLQIWQATGSPSQAWNFANQGGNRYTLSVDGGAYCLDSAGKSTPGSAVTVWSCGGGNLNQIWNAYGLNGGGYYFTSGNAGLCLDVRASGTANGTVAQTYSCNGVGGLSQAWTVNSGAGLPPAAPTGLTAKAGDTVVNLSWTGSAGATSYNVFCSTTAGGEGAIAQYKGVTSTVLQDHSVSDGTTYYYLVTAVDSDGEGQASTEVSATPFPAALASITAAPTKVTGGLTSTVTLTLNTAAPAGGIVVTLGSQNTAVAGFSVASGSVPAGATSATVSVKTNPVATNTWVTLSGKAVHSQTCLVEVLVPVVRSVQVLPSSVVGGSGPQNGTVTMSGPVVVATTVKLSSNNPDAQVPSSVSLQPGKSTATFTCTTKAVSAVETAMITATGAYNSYSYVVTIKP